MNTYHNVDNFIINAGVLTIIVDGVVREKLLAELSPVLANATAAELAQFNISPSGYGIHWPLLDEDIAIDGLLDMTHQPPARMEN